MPTVNLGIVPKQYVDFYFPKKSANNSFTGTNFFDNYVQFDDIVVLIRI